MRSPTSRRGKRFHCRPEAKPSVEGPDSRGRPLFYLAAYPLLRGTLFGTHVSLRTEE